MIAGLELGGTKTVVAVASDDGRLQEEYRFSTTTPDETLVTATGWILERGIPVSIGVASFGPVQLNRKSADWGKMLATPKPGWSGFGIMDRLRGLFPDAKLALDTDVNAACLAEARDGSAAGLEHVAYITIGTGIGAGILCDGKLLHGALHPEFGHVRPPRRAGDDFAGLCPFHGDCLEGLASGPAMKARWGRPAHDLPDDHPAWDLEAWYLAQGICALLSISAPERVIVGGGVSQADGLHGKVERQVRELAGGYFPILTDRAYVVSPRHGQQAGILGALILAMGTSAVS